MTVRPPSYSTFPLPLFTAIPRLVNILGDRALIDSSYTAVLLERWNMFYERARTAQNMAVCGVSYSKKCILVISVEGYATKPWRAVPGSQTDWKFWTMLGMMAGWDVEVVADSLPIWDPKRQPSKNNIRSFAYERLKDNKEGDQFILVFSGQCDDQGLMLADGSHISPQELRDWFVKPLASGSRLWTFFDCSESSNLLGLRYKIVYKRGRGTIYYRPAQSYAGYHDEGIRGTVISIGSAAGDCGEMVLFDGDESTQPVSCGALAWGVYYFFHAFCTEGEPLLAIFFPLMEMVLRSRPGQEVQITTSSKVRKPALPMLRAPS